MFGLIPLEILQHFWWFIISLSSACFICLLFVQGGQSLLFSLPHNTKEQELIITVLGRKWLIHFGSLIFWWVTFFAAFPKFITTSLGGAYWLWLLVLACFISQIVVYEQRQRLTAKNSQGNYDLFLLINGSLASFWVGVIMATFFTGGNFSLNDYNQVSWQAPTRGLEAISDLFNFSFGLFMVFLSRTLGGMYFLNSITDPVLSKRCRLSILKNFLWTLPFMLFITLGLVTMQGYAINPTTAEIYGENSHYFNNILKQPFTQILFFIGLFAFLYGILISAFQKQRSGFWFAEGGLLIIMVTIFITIGFHNTPFYPSFADLQSSLTIANASSSQYTLSLLTTILPFFLLMLYILKRLWPTLARK